MKTTININSQAFTSLVEKHIHRSKMWQKGENNRLYIYDCKMTAIFDTKKCKQTVYIDLNDYTVHSYTDCPAQSNAWERNESNRVIDELKPFARLLRILCKDSRELSDQPVELIMQEAELSAQEVTGYTTQWRNVRVAINRFGKLADKNRQYVVFLKTTKSDAPKNFQELPGDIYAACLQVYSTGETMLEPYGEAVDAVKIAVNIINQRMKEEESN